MRFGDTTTKKKRYKFRPKEEKKLNTSLIGAIILILIAIGLLIVLTAPKQKIPTAGANITNATENATINGTCDDLCWLSKAVEQKSAYACEQILNSTTAQECFEKVSSYSLDACVKVSDAVKRKECIISNAVKQKSKTICENLANESERNECMGKVDPCYQKTGSARNLCLALSEKNYTYCGNEESCILDVVKQTGKFEACTVLKVEAKQFACVALAKGENSCKNLPYPSERDQCFEILAIWENKPLLCDEITYNAVYALECYQYFAVIEKKKSYCENLEFNNKWSCYLNYSVGANDVSGCVAIDENAKISKVRCFTDFAMIDRNPGACALMDDPSNKIKCYYSSIFMKTEKPIPKENCANITSDTWKDKCYEYSATGNRDVTICNYIQDESVEKSCLDRFR